MPPTPKASEAKLALRFEDQELCSFEAKERINCLLYRRVYTIISNQKGGSISLMKAHLLEELVDALTTERRISVKGVREEALLLYLNTNPALKLDGAIALWRKGRISLAKAAEVVGLTVPEFKDVLAARGIVRETKGKSSKAMDAKLRDMLP